MAHRLLQGWPRTEPDHRLPECAPRRRAGCCRGSLSLAPGIRRLSGNASRQARQRQIMGHDHPRRSGAGEQRMGRPAGARPAAATPAAAARGSAKREDKDSLTVASPPAVRRLGCRGEDKDPPTFLIFPRSTTPPRRLPTAAAAAARAARGVRLLAARRSGGRTQDRRDGDGHLVAIAEAPPKELALAERRLTEVLTGGIDDG